ncbi:MAG: hypothetical protein K6T78_04210 [Alicyclobacillus sp.]|nr:hypothetical protein [Alicyclobacillus sp.]
MEVNQSMDEGDTGADWLVLMLLAKAAGLQVEEVRRFIRESATDLAEAASSS